MCLKSMEGDNLIIESVYPNGMDDWCVAVFMQACNHYTTKSAAGDLIETHLQYD